MYFQFENRIGSTSHASRCRGRYGLTLAELLIVIAIILVMGTLVLAVMRSAQEDAREAATNSRIEMIESLMQTVMEDYEVRRFPIDRLAGYVAENPILDTSTPNPNDTIPFGVQLKNLRRRILADMIQAEMPTFYFSAPGVFATNPDLGVFPTTTAPLKPEPVYVDGSLSVGFEQWITANYPNPFPSPMPGPAGPLLLDFLRQPQFRTSEMQYWGGLPVDAEFKEPGEYLYRLLERVDVDGTAALDLLGSAAVGNPDGDAHPDIVDGWGESMQFRILQVAIDETASDVSLDIFKDVDDAAIDWNRLIPVPIPPGPGTWLTMPSGSRILLPQGYETINPTIPRLPSQFRFQVVSPTLEAQND